MFKMVIESGASARKKILKGATKVGNIVGMSLGPFGRNAIIKIKYSAPQILNDGVTIARHVMFEDDIEDLGAQTLIEGSMKAEDRAGDGTTTTVVLASKIVEEYAKRIEEEEKTGNSMGVLGEALGTANVNKMAKEILETGKLTIQKLKEMAKPLETDQLKNVIASSLGTLFPEFVEDMTKTVEEVGKDGYISVEDNWHTKYGIDTELIKGMRFLGTYITPYMVNTKRKEAILEDVCVLICNYDIETMGTFLRDPYDPKKGSLIKDLIGKGIRKMVIIANKFEKPLIELLASTVVQARQGNTNLVDFLCVKAPSLTTEQFQDIAVYCNGTFFDKNRPDIDIRKAEISHLGFVKKIVVNEDEVMMMGGQGATDDSLIVKDKEIGKFKSKIKERIELLKEQIETEKDPAFKEQTKRRLGALQSGFAIIRVGAVTEGERVLAKRKIEDAIHAAQNALEEGVVPGGGLALKQIADELGEKHPMFTALRAPYDRIQTGAGGELEIPDTVLDPLKVTRIAVETACSVAASLITVDVGIAERKRTLWDELDKKLSPQLDVDDDFRDDINQDQKFK